MSYRFVAFGGVTDVGLISRHGEVNLIAPLYFEFLAAQVSRFGQLGGAQNLARFDRFDHQVDATR